MAVENYLSRCWKCNECEKDEEIVQPCTENSDRLCQCKAGFHKADGDDKFCVQDPSNAIPTGAPSGGGNTAGIVVAVVLLLLFGAAVAAFIYKKKGGKFPCDGEPGNPDQPGSTASPLLTKNKQNPEAVPSTDSIEVKFIKGNRAEIVRIVCDDPGSLLGEVESLGYADVHSGAIAQINKVDTMASPYTLKIIGGQGGNAFSFDGQENVATLQKLSVSVGGCQVRGIEVWLTDGRRKTFGTMYSSAQKFEFKSGEFITSLSLWNNEAGTHLGAIKFRTSHSREFFANMTDLELKNEYKIDVGSGICLGVQGRAGSDIDSMGFLFINAIKSSVIQDMKYPTMHQVLPNVQTEEIKEMQYKNETSVDQSYTFESSKKINKTSSWSTTNNIAFTFSLTVNAGTPKIIEVGGGFSFAEGIESKHKVEESEEETDTLTFPVSVPPHKTINVVATIGHVKIVLPYTALLRITCVNGAFLDAPLNGVYRGLTYTKMAAVTTES
ncbi:aerolysin-like protein isoform X2 [Lethenteron reissneri]|nr:aerolysin-like protein isoform X2 [Lethenteron reissneri]